MGLDFSATLTKILLDGQRPGQFDPALYDGRLKRNLIQAVKGKVYPVGLGHAGRHFILGQFLRFDSNIKRPRCL